MTAADPSLEVTDLDATSAALGDLTTLASPSLFGEPRLIRVGGVERLSEAFLTEALRYLEHPADETTVVLRHAGGVRGKKLLDAVRSGLGGDLLTELSVVDYLPEELESAAAEGIPVVTIGAPVFGENRRVVAAMVACPNTTLPLPELRTLAEATRASAAAISAHLP